jgi:predicted transcriptional regulator
MQALWRIEKGFVKDILDELVEPKPKYNTVSTIVRILEKKGFVNHKAYGKSHQYRPIVSKEAYTEFSLTRLLQNYFGNSFKNLVHFCSLQQNLDIREVEEVIEMLKKVREENQ